MMMPPPANHLPIDGIVDAAIVAVGMVITFGKACWRLYFGDKVSLSGLGTDFLNGTVVIPFVLMIGAVFSSTLLEYLRSTSPVSTAIAGAIGLLFVSNELLKE
jgi:hypothetical protein